MSTYERLTQVYQNSFEVPFDQTSRLILFSDVHRGDNSWADDFATTRACSFLHWSITSRKDLLISSWATAMNYGRTSTFQMSVWRTAMSSGG